MQQTRTGHAAVESRVVPMRWAAMLTPPSMRANKSIAHFLDQIVRRPVAPGGHQGRLQFRLRGRFETHVGAALPAPGSFGRREDFRLFAEEALLLGGSQFDHPQTLLGA